MTIVDPWISFHAPWTSRARSGLVVLDQIQRFLAAVAVDPAPDSADLVVRQARGELGDEARRRFGPDTRRGSSDAQVEWRWERPVDLAPLVDFYRAHEHLPRIGLMAVVDLRVSCWFEVKRPGTTAPLFPGAELRSSVLVSVGARHINLSIRYQTPDFTPELRATHSEIVAALGPKTPRHALQQIIPARNLHGRERRVPIA